MKTGYYKEADGRYVPCKILGRSMKYEIRFIPAMGVQGSDRTKGSFGYYLVETEDGTRKEIPEENMFIEE